VLMLGLVNTAMLLLIISGIELVDMFMVAS
jgi:hypothetical protein